MNFTTTPPTTPGFYAWRSCKGDDRDFCGNVWEGADGAMWASIGTRVDHVKEIDGEWCRLVPAEEVEKGYKEGASLANLHQGHIDSIWNYSRAKQVAEGKI